MGLAFAHTLELPQQMGYNAPMWTSVMHGLYLYFAIVGGPQWVFGHAANFVLAFVGFLTLLLATVYAAAAAGEKAAIAAPEAGSEKAATGHRV
jgi:hypothetical protein